MTVSSPIYFVQATGWPTPQRTDPPTDGELVSLSARIVCMLTNDAVAVARTIVLSAVKRSGHCHWN